MTFEEILSKLPAPYYRDEQSDIAIFHADCRELLPLIPDKVVDLVLTDPPYSLAHVDGGGFASACTFYREGALEGLTDFHLQEYRLLLRKVSEQIIAFHSRDQIRDYADFCLQDYGHYDLHVWHKVNAIPFTHNTWKSDIEYIALGWAAKNHVPIEQHLKSKVWRSGIETGSYHPAQKPTGLIDKYIRVLGAQLILDPFLGSGTTAVCAKKLGRKCIGIEIEEKYCEIAAKRLSQSVMRLEVEHENKPD